MKKTNINDREEIKKKVKDRADKEKESIDDSKEHSTYFISNGYLCRKKYSRDGGETTVKLCNFTARITEENLIDDGQDSDHLFTIEGKLFDKVPLSKLEIAAEKFSGLSWVSKWGSKAILEPGQTVKDYVRHAIQTTSKNVPEKTHYGHLGWRFIKDQWVYLHAGGAIGEGPNKDISVRLTKELERYSFPLYPTNQQASDGLPADDEKKALEASLSFIDIGNHAVTIPLFCMIYLAPLTTLLNPMPNFSFYLFGISGTWKTTLALIALAHFGRFSGVESLSSFDDTIGILEKRSFVLKDTLNVIDDFHPSSNRKAAESKEGVAQRMIRAYSNRTARGRLNSDMTERGRYEPRGMMLMTAEEQPTLESTLARVCIIEVIEGAIEKEKLTGIQAKTEYLPLAMASYINWIRENINAIRESFPGRFRELRARAASEGSHKKLPEQSAAMGFAIETATSFFYDKGILTEEAAAALVSEAWAIFRQLALQQQQRIAEDDPVSLFFEIISVLIMQGQARIETMPGYVGDRIGSSEQHIGWYDSSCIYLMPAAVWHVVQRRCIAENTHFPFTKNTFFKMLKNRNIITPAKSGETSNVITIGKKSVRVLKIIEEGIYNKLVKPVNE